MFEKYIDLEGLNFGEPLTSAGLTMVPISFAADHGPSWQTLADALAAGSAVITEVSDAGTVPQLLFRNHGETPVLLLDGEELIGAKQNRILNLTILAPAKADIGIPVSCVERGRWSWRSREFSASNRTIYAKLRASKSAQVSRSMSRGDGRRSDQQEIWSDIADKSASMYAFSETGAASAIYDSNAEDLDRVLTGMRTSDGQAGAIFIVNGRFAGVELFGSAHTFAKVFGKITRGYAVDCVEERIVQRPPGSDRPEGAPSWFRGLMKAEVERHKALGLGDDLRLAAPNATGGALVVDRKLVHLYAFPRDFAGERYTHRSESHV
jgi:hypothetical protein